VSLINPGKNSTPGTGSELGGGLLA